MGGWVGGWCIYIYICMYVCMYVCMFVCLYVCMYVCMHVCMHACMHACSIMYACIPRRAAAALTTPVLPAPAGPCSKTETPKSSAHVRRWNTGATSSARLRTRLADARCAVALRGTPVTAPRTLPIFVFFIFFSDIFYQIVIYSLRCVVLHHVAVGYAMLHSFIFGVVDAMFAWYFCCA